jgi:hypothetical protein
MLHRDDLDRLFVAKHKIYTPDDSIDGEPDERPAIMERFAKELYRTAGTLLVNCPPNAERDIAIRRMHEALLYADLSLLLGNYEESPWG